MNRNSGEVFQQTYEGVLFSLRDADLSTEQLATLVLILFPKEKKVIIRPDKQTQYLEQQLEQPTTRELLENALNAPNEEQRIEEVAEVLATYFSEATHTVVFSVMRQFREATTDFEQWQADRQRKIQEDKIFNSPR